MGGDTCTCTHVMNVHFNTKFKDCSKVNLFKIPEMFTLCLKFSSFEGQGTIVIILLPFNVLRMLV